MRGCAGATLRKARRGKYWVNVMARGRKKETRTLDEQLQAVIGEIATYEEKLKELRRRKKEIEQKITEDKKEALYKAVMESGKSLDEVLASLTNE